MILVSAVSQATVSDVQPNGRAARRLVALGDILERTRPIWIRLAQAAVRNLILVIMGML